MTGDPVRITMDGHVIDAPAGASLIQAWIGAGLPLTGNVGCMGQGVCGACRGGGYRQPPITPNPPRLRQVHPHVGHSLSPRQPHRQPTGPLHRPR